ncbi:glycosyltransferase family 4 protein [Qipengyuania flava]|nr:glycosyltransferase family 4 protein [Qipengyuania flava]
MVVKVLSVNDFYLPGFKAGGPIRTLQNMVKATVGALEFYILTRDHDLGGGRYEGIRPNRWANGPQVEVFYASDRMFGLPALSKALSSRKVDVLYLNSFFSPKGSIAIMLRNRVRAFAVPILLAPRGEFSQGALAAKSGKKRLYITFARLLGLYKMVWWHASTQEEADDILRQFPNARPRIFTAENPVEAGDEERLVAPKKEPGRVKLIFVSRISPKKNLDGLLDILTGLQCKAVLQIYGPIEDQEYWQRCAEKIADLPRNVTAEYRGELTPDGVSRVFAEGDLFAFPTHGENFGHVIFESLRAGTPVVLSDQTPWQPDDTSAVVRLPLRALKDWRDHIEKVGQLNDGEQQARRTEALRYARRHATSGKALRDNLRMFETIAQRFNMEVDC